METRNSKSIQTCSWEDFTAELRKTTDPILFRKLLATRALTDVRAFAGQVVPHHLRLPFADFHHNLMEWHRRMADPPLPGRRGLRFALAAPRGSAKSTLVSLILALHDVVFRREHYIVIVSATQRQAQQRLRTLYAELRHLSTLGTWCGPAVRLLSKSSHHIELAGIRIEAYGAGSEMRGITFQSWRPTKIILDDAESSAAAESAHRRAKLYDWFQEVVEHLGHGYTHLLVVGTILHPESLLARILERPDFETAKHRSIEKFADPAPEWDEWRRLLTDPSIENRRAAAREYFEIHRESMQKGAQVLWPEHEDYEELRAQLVLQGRRAFYQEKQNEPLGPEEALFEPEQAWRARRTAAGIEIVAPPSMRTGRQGLPGAVRTYLPASLRHFGYHDAALGKSGAQHRGDFAALATVALAPDGVLILLGLWVKRAPPSQQVSTLFDLHALEPFEALAIEGTGFQELLTMPIEEERKRRRARGLRCDLPLQVIKPSRKKESRIAAMEPLLASGKLILSEELPEEFWTELMNFPRVEHDDALDAAAGAIELAQNAGAFKSKSTQTAPHKKGGLLF